MSNAEVTTPNHRVVGVPWKSGQSGNPAGRPKGARSKLGAAFIQDLAAAWEKHGDAALEACAAKDPGTFLKVIASLMPRDINLNVAVSAADFVDKFRSAQAMLGNEVTPLPRKTRVIEHSNAG